MCKIEIHQSRTKLNILLIGQCTLHWGRMEYGNIGNYYIIESLIQGVRRVFPTAILSTTFQLSREFSKREKITILPMEYYYGWSECDLTTAKYELKIAREYSNNSFIKEMTPFIKEVLKSELVIDFSGDIWGDNSNFLGENRFLIGLIKDRVAQLLGKNVAMIAGSPGPFSNKETLIFAREVYKSFDLVTNRDAISTRILKNNHFDISKTRSLSCPSFLFSNNNRINILNKSFKSSKKLNQNKPIVGFILCGWNFVSGPFDKKMRPDEDFIVFAKTIEHITSKLNANVVLMSHSNGFNIDPKIPFKLEHGRDYFIIKQLEQLLVKRGSIQDVHTINDVYDARETKSIISNFDMLISGRMHGAIAALAECIPTVIIDYGHEPKAHKLQGLVENLEIQQYLANPDSYEDLKQKTNTCFANKLEYKKHLEIKIPKIKAMANQNFDLLKQLIYG